MISYLIDPVNLEVRIVNLPEGEAEMPEIYKLIEADVFECVTINKAGDTIYIDEEGMLGDLTQQVFFMYAGFPHPLAGKGLIIGLDKATGESRSATIILEEVESKVSYLTPAQVQRWARENKA